MKRKVIAVLSIVLAINFVSGCTSTPVAGNKKTTTGAAITTKSAVTTTKQAIATTGAAVTASAITTGTAVTTSAITTGAAVTASAITTGTASKIVMKIENEVITEDDVDEELETIPEQYKPYYQNEEGRKKIIDNLINQKILMIVAKKQEIEKDPEFEKDMNKLKERVLANYAVRKNVLDKIKATDEEIAAKYNQEKESYKTGEQVKASHILLMFKQEMKEEDKKALLTKAEGILKGLIDGKDFAEAAKANSEDGSAANGGNLGWFGKGTMVKEFEDACFTGEAGKIYPKIVETQFGYHIIKVEEKKPESYKPIEEVKEKLSEDIVAGKRNSEFNKWMEALKKEYIK